MASVPGPGRGDLTTISVDLPQDLTCSGDLSIVLSNLVENALIASGKQPEDRRNITVLARQQGDMLNILVKNLFDAPVLLDEEGLPVTKVKGHGIGMKSLARFRDKYGASVSASRKTAGSDLSPGRYGVKERLGA